MKSNKIKLERYKKKLLATFNGVEDMYEVEVVATFKQTSSKLWRHITDEGHRKIIHTKLVNSKGDIVFENDNGFMDLWACRGRYLKEEDILLNCFKIEG